jgi:hypothetical protein
LLNTSLVATHWRPHHSAPGSMPLATTMPRPLQPLDYGAQPQFLDAVRHDSVVPGSARLSYSRLDLIADAPERVDLGDVSAETDP